MEPWAIMTFTLPASSGEANSGALLYLGISGVLHPSVSEYSQRYQRLPGSDGHTLYEGAPLLAKLLGGWPEVRIVLTSSLPRIYSFEMVLEQLGRHLARRVDGYTYEDLTGPMAEPLPVLIPHDSRAHARHSHSLQRR